MSHDHMSMGSMGPLPALTEFPGFYYAVVASAVAVATSVNVYNHVLYRQRLSAAREGSRTPAKPTSWFALGNATTYALTREASNFSIRIPVNGRILRLPTVGRIAIIVANAVVLVVLCLYGLDLNDQFSLENVGFRCGVVTMAQIPIIVLLAGKNNIIGYLGGISYERLNWLHRWCARCMLLTATMHMGYFFSAWAPYDYIDYQLKNNNIVWKGLAAWCTLFWIVFSSMTPIRGWSYEIFVIQHIISFAVFLAFAYIHTPVEMNGYVWAPVAIFLFDRVCRALRLVYINLSIFHPSSQMKGFWACRAEFTPLPHNTTRIVVWNPPISWTPGQHVYLSCQSVVPLQSHPFTIASIPRDGKMEFYVKAEKGGTKRFYRHAETSGRMSEASSSAKSVTIEGPYGVLRPLRQFDSVVLLAGSTGSTFTIPLLRDLVQGWQENIYGDRSKPKSFVQAPSSIVTRHVRFVWVVKSRGQLSWFSEQLSSIYANFQTLQQKLRDIKLEMSVYITCDSSFTEGHKSLLSTIATATPMNSSSSANQGKETAHSMAQYQPLRQSTASSDTDAKHKAEEKDTNGDGIREVRLSSSSSMEMQDLSCAQNKNKTANTCCCRATISETDSLTPQTSCRCPVTPTWQSRPNSLPPLSTPTKNPLLHPCINVYAGRPQTRNMIRRSLEQAWGESAVVVCGPQGLVADVKCDVVALSDERAVHKGTGAQGIYLHTESFGW